MFGRLVENSGGGFYSEGGRYYSDCWGTKENNMQPNEVEPEIRDRQIYSSICGIVVTRFVQRLAGGKNFLGLYFAKTVVQLFNPNKPLFFVWCEGKRFEGNQSQTV